MPKPTNGSVSIVSKSGTKRGAHSRRVGEQTEHQQEAQDHIDHKYINLSTFLGPIFAIIFDEAS